MSDVPVPANMTKNQLICSLYTNSAKMLEYLNVLISKLDRFDAEVDDDLLEKVSETCWEIAADICTNKDLIVKKKSLHQGSEL